MGKQKTGTKIAETTSTEEKKSRKDRSEKKERRQSSKREKRADKTKEKETKEKSKEHNGNGETNKRTREPDHSVEETRPHKKSKNTSPNEQPKATQNNKNNDNKKEASSGSSTPSYLTSDTDSISKFQSEHGISVYGDVTNFLPFSTFTGFDKDILQCTKTFKQPSPIQAQTWPILLSHRDVIGIAETGSGKTLAFGLPGLTHIKEEKKKSTGKGPFMLVITPTRELAQQNHDVLHKAGLGCNPNIITSVIYGGVPKYTQTQALRAGVDVLIACPGRLLDLMSDGSCDISKVSYMVLDEADRMLDMGFEPDIRRIFSQIKKVRQTVMFSATWPKSIQLLASEFQTNPIRVVVGSDSLTANTKVEQIVEVVEQDTRDHRLLELLKQYHNKKEKALIFVLYKKEATRLESFLRRKGYACSSIHGNKSTVQRAEALEGFKKGTPPLLIATDVAARGLDIPKVEYVINFEFPLTIEDYIHRIGRTGRAGATGISHTFFSKFDKNLSGELVGVLRAANATVPEQLLAFGVAVKKKEPKLGKINMNATSNRITFDSSDEDD